MNNLALNKNATASSYVSPFSAAKAVDGTLEPINRWLCDYAMPSWLNVDLGAPYWITRWIVKHMGVVGWSSPDYNMKNYKLQGSMNNSTWVDLDTVVNNTSSTTDRSFTPSQARYVRVYVSTGLNINQGVASIVDFEVIEAPPTSSLLSGLATSSGTLTPPFSKQTYSYSESVGYDTDKITVTPIAEDINATIEVNSTVVPSGHASQEIGLNPGTNAITVKVTSAVGSVISTYTINATRASSPYLTGLIVRAGRVVLTLNPAFTKNNLSYSTNANGASSVTITPTAEDSSAHITVNGTDVPSGQSSQSINLNDGQNTITVKVLSAVGEDQKIYNFTVTK